MPADADRKAKQLYEFGPFRVDPEKELLLRGEETVPLTPKTIQILLVLMRHSKELVTKDDLMKMVWPDTFVEEANLSRNIFLLRRALGESPQDHQYIVTVPGRGYRFAETVQWVPEQELSIVAASHAKVQVEVKETKPWPWSTVAVVLLIAVSVGAFRLLLRRSPVLTNKDTVVLADFSNSTGDPVFDGTLRQGLAVQLEQSPFLSLVSDQRIQRTLRLMNQPTDARISGQTAQEICERTGSAAVLEGSISNLGTQFVLGLRATSCRTGETLDQEQAQAARREDVLNALGQVANKFRTRIGESLTALKSTRLRLKRRLRVHLML
jgi:DNA-binding winged helix-turn-helix (wHTH) protein